MTPVLSIDKTFTKVRRCDFDGDGICGVADIDLLGHQVAQGGDNTVFDLTGNGLFDRGDVDDFLALVGRLDGDAGLDGVVGFADFLQLSSNFGADGLWSQGDFDSNGSVQFADFLLLSSKSGQTSSAVSAVAEPHGRALVYLGWVHIVALRRRWRSSELRAAVTPVGIERLQRALPNCEIEDLGSAENALPWQ